MTAERIDDARCRGRDAVAADQEKHERGEEGESPREQEKLRDHRQHADPVTRWNKRLRKLHGVRRDVKEGCPDPQRWKTQITNRRTRRLACDRLPLFPLAPRLVSAPTSAATSFPESSLYRAALAMAGGAGLGLLLPLGGAEQLGTHPARGEFVVLRVAARRGRCVGAATRHAATALGRGGGWGASWRFTWRRRC